ncbi:cytochrome P450 86B1-like protein [Carex littledalei]|uniref:Cytochrome P450 86B1-like protein n=1 Tax=Carex littledalei TaxID=544730 RepID=A0A833VCR5_9POAL|nr:cytochrome P450 86B1-like protein [Carex littledalei]
MPLNILVSVFQNTMQYLTLSDLAIAMLILFICSAAIQRLTTNGPMLWPVVGIVPTVLVNVQNTYDFATDALIKTGGTFPFRGIWFGKCYGVVTVVPANIEYILKTRFTNFPKGKYYRERFAELLGDGIFNADDQTWRDQRRAVTAEMHSSQYAEYSADTIRSLVHSKLLVLINWLSKTGSCVDLQDLFLRFTFDNICRAAFGVDPGCLAIGLPDIPFANEFERATELILFRFTVPPFVWKLMRALNIGTEKQLSAAIQTVHEFAEKTVSDRRDEFKKVNGFSERYDLLSRLMVTAAKFSDKMLKDLCISFILAGRDTSSVGLTWFFWLLHRHPDVERCILDEITNIIKRRTETNVGNPANSHLEIVFTAEELKKMVYLQAAISEALRLYPPVPLDFKEVLEDDVLPDGTFVKEGARVIYSMYSMARMEGIWGKDCKEFKPERWLRDGKCINESASKYVVFNAGPRLCIGKKFAYMQMKMVAASILLRYHVVVQEKQEVVPKLTTTLYMRNGLRVNFQRRENGLICNVN